MPKKKILCIDDDLAIQTVLEAHLEEEGFEPFVAGDRSLGLSLAQQETPHVVLLDLTLEDGSTLPLIPLLKQHAQAGVIIVSGKTDTTEKVVGLEMGADDYVTKPFELRELTARINALLRRIPPASAQPQSQNAKKDTPDQQQKFFFDGWCLDKAQFQLFDPNGDSAGLTSGEFKLLDTLVSAAGRVCTREHLFEITRDANYDSFDRAVDIQIARLRKKIGWVGADTGRIKTVRGVGYMFTGKVEAVSE